MFCAFVSSYALSPFPRILLLGSLLSRVLVILCEPHSEPLSAMMRVLFPPLSNFLLVSAAARTCISMFNSTVTYLCTW